MVGRTDFAQNHDSGIEAEYGECDAKNYPNDVFLGDVAACHVPSAHRRLHVQQRARVAASLKG